MRTLQNFKPGARRADGRRRAGAGRRGGPKLHQCPDAVRQPSYYGQFTDTGQLNKGDKVRITGVDVGTVQGLTIDGDHVVIKFSLGSNTIGTESRLAIKTDTILGKKVLEIEPRGTQTLRPRGVLPLGQSTTPYQIYDAFFDVTKAASGGTSTPSSGR